MEKVKKSGKHSADFGLRILSIILAVIIWFVLSITQYPTINKTITGVPVVFTIDGTAAQEKGLSVIDSDRLKNLTVDVEIKGMNYEIGGYTANDLVANVNLDDVTKAGTYELDIDVKSTHTTDRCSVLSIKPDKVKVDFDRLMTKPITLGVEAPLISAEEGYTLKESVVDPLEVTVQGAEKDLENLNRASVQIAKSEKIKSDMTVESEKVVFYDADDNVLDSSKFSIKDAKNFNVRFTVYKKKTANLVADITGCPEGFDKSSLPIRMSEDSISVITAKLDDGDSEDINVGSIPLSEINLSKSFKFTIPIADGEINQTGIKEVTISFDKTGYTSKTFNISGDHIKAVKTPAGKKASIETKKLNNVTIIGPADVIANIKSSDIYADVDISDIVDSGSYSRAAMVYAKGFSNVWCYGRNDVQVVVGNK